MVKFLTVWMYSKWLPSCWKFKGFWLRSHWKATSSDGSCVALQLKTTLSPTVTSTLLGLSSTRMASESTTLLHCHGATIRLPKANTEQQQKIHGYYHTNHATFTWPQQSTLSATFWGPLILTVNVASM